MNQPERWAHEDEERWNRLIADAGVLIGLAIVGAIGVSHRLVESMNDFERRAYALSLSLEQGLTSAQRIFYDGLCRCGTPPLDALCEAIDLAPNV